MRLVRPLPALVVALLLLPTGATPAQAAGATHRVAIEGMKFVPERIEVAAGDTVVWTNKDFLPHSVTAAAAKVESGDLAEGKSFKFVAKTKGEMPYICRLHPVMRGTLIVR
jgi:plastocyanin